MQLAFAVFDHHEVRDARTFVEKFAQCFAVDEVRKADVAALGRKNHVVVRIPFEQDWPLATFCPSFTLRNDPYGTL